MSELAEQQFAKVLASSGGLGLAKLVVSGLERNR
jgi:Rod binding domain-containing protein